MLQLRVSYFFEGVVRESVPETFILIIGQYCQFYRAITALIGIFLLILQAFSGVLTKNSVTIIV
jgi:hypothetical protein